MTDSSQKNGTSQNSRGFVDYFLILAIAALSGLGSQELENQGWVTDTQQGIVSLAILFAGLWLAAKWRKWDGMLP